ncbi:MAG: carbon-nitrogen hydrolase family protein [Petrotogales bacterium]
MQRITASLIQFKVEPMNIEKNLQKAYSLLSDCVKKTDSSLIVFPESFTTGFTPKGTVQELWNAVDPIPGPTSDRAIKWAKEFNTYLCFPAYERGEEFPIVYNSAALIGPEGLLGVYRKTHPFPNERLAAGGWTTPGNKPFCMETPIGKIGIVICYDGDFPELSRVTALMGAEIICRPSAFLRTYDQWELTNKARAYDNHVYWLATNLVGEDARGASFFGSSMIVHPSGQKMAQASGCDEFVWAELDPEPIKTISPSSSRKQNFDHLQDRNLKAYKNILDEGKSSFEPNKRIPTKGTGGDEIV